MLKKQIIILFIIVFIAECPSYAGWALIHSYPTPGNDPRGYRHYDGYTGYILQDGTDPYIYRIYWWTGSIYNSFPAPGGAGAWGLGFDRTGVDYFWISNYQNSWFYQVTTAGSLVSSFPSPLPGPAGMDILFDFTYFRYYLYVAFPSQNKIAKIDQTSGSLVVTYAAPGTYPTACGGLYYQGNYFFVTDSSTHTVYQGGVPVITNLQTPVGFSFEATTNDEYRFIHVVDDATDRIYFYWSNTSVTPASLGRIKALFR